jgi:hypothetical protein
MGSSASAGVIEHVMLDPPGQRSGRNYDALSGISRLAPMEPRRQQRRVSANSPGAARWVTSSLPYQTTGTGALPAAPAPGGDDTQREAQTVAEQL